MIIGPPVRGTIYRTQGGTRLYLSQRFGCTGFRWEPPLGNCAHFHRGLDIARSDGAGGADILAVLPGVVKVSLREGNGENIIAIHHGDGIVSYAGHLRARLVSAGERVSKGQHIGEMGTTGNSTGNHLHFAMKRGVDLSENLYPDRNGTWFDPWPLIEQNVTVRPKQGTDNIRIRASLSLADSAIYAETQLDGRIRRTADEADLGLVSTWRNWLGVVTGPKYSVGGTASTRWEKFQLGSKVVYIASLLAQRSAS